MAGLPPARRNTNELRPPQPNEPERAAPRRLEYATGPSLTGPMLHEPAALWLPNKLESGRAAAPEGLEFMLPDPPAPGALHEPATPWLPNEPEAPLLPNEPKPGQDRQGGPSQPAA